MNQVFRLSWNFRISSKCVCRSPHCEKIKSSAISSLIMADWPLNYIIQNFKRSLPPPEISATQRASFPLGWTPLASGWGSAVNHNC